MDVAIFGARGLLGQDIVKVGRARAWSILTPTREQVDITDAAGVRAFFAAAGLRWAINCAAYVAVDDAESEPGAAFALNSQAVHNIAAAAVEFGCRLIHISTDYVFNGGKRTPYTEEDEPRPLGVYAASKLEGERRAIETAPASIIARTAWLYGAGRENFPSKILRAAITGKSLRLVSDRVGSPTYTADLAVALTDIIEMDIAPGIYHVVNEGTASWYDLCAEMIDYAGIHVDIEPVGNDEYPTPAQRPLYSVLSTQKLQSAGVPALPHWRDAVRRFVDELRETGAIET